MEWARFEDAVVAGVDRAVRAAVAAHPGERFYAAALAHIYRETDGPITLPGLGVNSDEALARFPDLRWSPADWEGYDDGWLGAETGAWERALTEEACRGTTRQWETTFRRYLTVLVKACRRVRRSLVADGVTDREFVVLVLDDELHESLVKRVLPAAEVARHFPELDERARIAALPEAERVAYYVSRLGTFEGPVGGEDAEDALRALGNAAIPALVPLLAAPGLAWRAAKLLAAIGVPAPDVVTALGTALTSGTGPDRAWVAVALARLGRLDAVLDRAERLPREVVVRAAAAPYTSFRDETADPPPLDYGPLASLSDRSTTYAAALAEELRPGRGYCTITAAEAATAEQALASPHPVVRWHAVSVLGDRRLGRAVARTVLPSVAEMVVADKDATVRRLAILSLLRWRGESRRYAAQVRHALEDPDPGVRDAAAYWLREQQA
jgi:hypothetical protein